MKKIEGFSTRHPILFGFSLIVVFSLFTVLTWPLGQWLSEPEGSSLGESVAKLLIAGCFILLLWRLGWLSRSGLTRLGRPWMWAWAGALLLYKGLIALYAFTGSLRFPLPPLDLGAAILLTCLATGLLEEIMYRGLLLGAMVQAWGSSRRGLAAAALASSAFWASLHLFNLLLRPFPLVAFQVGETLLSGFVYAALLLAGGSIWPLVLLHGLFNAMVNLPASQIPGFEETTSAWLLMISAALPLLFLGQHWLRQAWQQRTAGGGQSQAVAAEGRPAQVPGD